MQVVAALVLYHKLTLTGLGRNIKNAASTRNNIKKVDRLLRNKHMHNEAVYFYKELAQLVIKNNKNPNILVDWICISTSAKLYLLRASLSMKVVRLYYMKKFIQKNLMAIIQFIRIF